MGRDSSKIVDCINNIIVADLSKYSAVRTIFCVGSMSKTDYVFRKNNDYDIRILVSEISDAILEATNRALNKCVDAIKKYSELEVSYSCMVGPVRFISRNNKDSLLIHCLLMTENALQDLPIMHRLSYAKQYRLLYGEDVLRHFTNLRLTLSGILNDSEGIDYCIQHLLAKVTELLYWEKIENTYTLQKKIEGFTPESSYEFCMYSIKKSTANLCEYIIQENIEEYLSDISKMEDVIKPYPEFEEFVNDMDKYISATVNYLKKLYVFANKLKVTYES